MERYDDPGLIRNGGVQGKIGELENHDWRSFTPESDALLLEVIGLGSLVMCYSSIGTPRKAGRLRRGGKRRRE